jgi:beta-glucosidase
MDEQQPATFPRDFLWGAATAAYQIEGAAAEDGRGESIWDRFCTVPGAVRNGDTGAVACDSYHRFPQDVELMRELGLDAFRFSIAWPRILPDGRGRIEPRGLDFYDRLVESLLAAGIRPFATLYHWDLPQRLENEGGWPARGTAEAFAEYVDIVVERLGDRVLDWATHNEPFCTAWLGYAVGLHAPGRQNEADALAAVHHVLLSHGWAVEAVRRGSPGSRVGIVLDSWPAHSVTDDPQDEEAAQQADALRNRLYFDPVFLGTYPQEALELLAPAVPPVRDGDLATISAPLDFLGVNCYSRTIVRADPSGGRPIEVRSPTGRLTDMGWEVYPSAVHEVLTRVRRDYDPPAIYVTESGAAYADVLSHDGGVHDRERIAFHGEYIDAVGRAAAEGVPVQGYFVWTLLDNFEWSFGYSKRFGIVYTDYPTLERIPKDSFGWYRALIAAHRAQAAAA